MLAAGRMEAYGRQGDKRGTAAASSRQYRGHARSHRRRPQLLSAPRIVATPAADGRTEPGTAESELLRCLACRPCFSSASARPAAARLRSQWQTGESIRELGHNNVMRAITNQPAASFLFCRLLSSPASSARPRLAPARAARPRCSMMALAGPQHTSAAAGGLSSCHHHGPAS